MIISTAADNQPGKVTQTQNSENTAAFGEQGITAIPSLEGATADPGPYCYGITLPNGVGNPAKPISTFMQPEVGVLLFGFAFLALLYARGLKTAGTGAKTSSFRFDLFRLPGLKRLVKLRSFLFWVRLPSAALFILVLAAGFFGNPRHNLAPGFTWMFWWTALIFFVAFAGKVFCTVCPWDFFANLFQFGGLSKNGKAPQSFNLKWPKLIRNIYPAALLFIVLTWLELGFDITRNGYMTAFLGLALVATAVFCALVFERRSFCRYACPVGRISGLYSQFSPIELRKNDADVCRTCKTKECVRGTETTVACPTKEIPFKLDQNTYCTLCTECIRSCPNDNLTLKVRPFASDLGNPKTSRGDESILAVIMLTLTYFHGLTMTSVWFSWTNYLSLNLEWTYLQSFTVLMAALLAGALAFFSLFGRLIDGSNGGSSLLTFAYAFIPIALGYHLGHNAMHLFGEILYLVPTINDPFGIGWNLFALAYFQPRPLMSHNTLHWLQLACIASGFFFSVKVLRQRVIAKIFEPRERRRLFTSFAGLLFMLGLLALWLASQPMVAKSGF